MGVVSIPVDTNMEVSSIAEMLKSGMDGPGQGQVSMHMHGGVHHSGRDHMGYCLTN